MVIRMVQRNATAEAIRKAHKEVVDDSGGVGPGTVTRVRVAVSICGPANEGCRCEAWLDEADAGEET